MLKQLAIALMLIPPSTRACSEAVPNPDPIATTVACEAYFNESYDRGYAALPNLINSLDDQRPAWCICNRSIIEGWRGMSLCLGPKIPVAAAGGVISDCAIEGTADSAVYSSKRTMGHLALYLIVSILKGEQRHAPFCTGRTWVPLAPRVMRRLKKKLRKLYAISTKENRQLTTTDVMPLLNRYGITFTDE